MQGEEYTLSDMAILLFARWSCALWVGERERESLWPKILMQAW